MSLPRSKRSEECLLELPPVLHVISGLEAAMHPPNFPILPEGHLAPQIIAADEADGDQRDGKQGPGERARFGRRQTPRKIDWHSKIPALSRRR